MKHTKNGLIQTGVNLRNGYDIMASIATGIEGESACLIINNNDLMRDVSIPREYIIRFDDVDEMIKLMITIRTAIRQRNKSLKR